MKTSLLTLFILLLSIPVQAMTDGCGAGRCQECHSLSKKEAADLLQKGGIDKVLNVEFSEMPGVWEVEVEKDRKRFPVYIDFSKSFVVTGNIIRIADGENVTQRRTAQLNRVDVSRIALEDALLLGREDARTKVIVFTDPECPYCRKLHAELKDVIERRPDIAFLIKLFPLKMHPNAYDISRSIVCTGSMELLELSFAGKLVPPAFCPTSAVDQTIATAEALGIRSTPTLVLPDGLVAPGYKKADDLIKFLDRAAGAE